MPTWNIAEDEVYTERLRQRSPAAYPMPRSYKAQALRELARRLELEDTLREVKGKLGMAIHRAEAAEAQLLLWPQPAPTSKEAL